MAFSGLRGRASRRRPRTAAFARIRYGTTRALTLTRLEVGRRRYVWRVTLDGQEYGVTAPKGVRLTPGQRVHAELVFHLSKGFFAVYATKPQGLNDGQYLGRATLIPADA